MVSWYAGDSSPSRKGCICRGRYLGSVADGVEQQKALDPLGMGAGVRQRHAAAHAVTHQREAIETERIGHRSHIGGDCGDGVLAVLGRLRAAVAAEIEGHRPP